MVEAHATALNSKDTFWSIHIAKTGFSETFRPRGSSSVTNNWMSSVAKRFASDEDLCGPVKHLTSVHCWYVNAEH